MAPLNYKWQNMVIDFLHNHTFDGNLYVDSVLDSSGTSEYPADLRSESPSNSLSQAGSARSLMLLIGLYKLKVYHSMQCLLLAKVL
jgi:hypothetical protein